MPSLGGWSEIARTLLMLVLLSELVETGSRKDFVVSFISLAIKFVAALAGQYN